MIRLLDAETIGQIAAGEVIERPLSVVKELVENALDAGATRVSVRVRGGGVDEIEVADDGAGIAPSELALAAARHATSKLESAEDLQRVETLGFRGEGLASIAAVAELEIVSRPGTAEIGARLAAHAESIGGVEPVPAPVGTRVVARELFANVPVRREFLRSASAEFARISHWLATFALAYPEVTFSLAHDGRETWVLPASEAYAQRLAHVFGAKAAEALLPLEPLPAAHRIGVAGFVSAAGSDRPDRRMQVLFVNRRLLRSTVLAGAWTAGYATFAMSGRHPYGVLFLALPPDHVDPNVHPTKSDVRLRYDRAVFDTVRATIASTLRGRAQQRLADAVSFAPPPGTDGALAQAPLFAPDAEPATLPRLRVVAQVDATYILATDGSALVLFDQHAAHERIAFEAIAANAQSDAPGEPLLVPLTFELDGPQSEILDGALETLRAGGLEIEPFGERVYRIVATPAGFRAEWSDGRRDFEIAEFIRDLGDEVRGLSQRERIWASLACHSVVRAGARLSELEMTTLVQRLQGCRNPMHCPHGRPTIVRLEPDAIARLFKRS